LWKSHGLKHALVGLRRTSFACRADGPKMPPGKMAAADVVTDMGSARCLTSENQQSPTCRPSLKRKNQQHQKRHYRTCERRLDVQAPSAVGAPSHLLQAHRLPSPGCQRPCRMLVEDGGKNCTPKEDKRSINLTTALSNCAYEREALRIHCSPSIAADADLGI